MEPQSFSLREKVAEGRMRVGREWTLFCSLDGKGRDSLQRPSPRPSPE